jgi:hypothetical protein
VIRLQPLSLEMMSFSSTLTQILGQVILKWFGCFESFAKNGEAVWKIRNHVLYTFFAFKLNKTNLIIFCFAGECCRKQFKFKQKTLRVSMQPLTDTTLFSNELFEKSQHYVVYSWFDAPRMKMR